jgi:pimeloyl-ACP methyl ester carboxylesterase
MNFNDGVSFSLNFFEIEPGRKIAYRVYDFEKKNQDCFEKDLHENQDNDIFHYEDDYENQDNSKQPQKEKKFLICIHALTRNGMDFDFLARQLAEDYIVICPDLPGRGQSDYLENKEDYNYEFYSDNLLKLIDFLGIKNCYWLGVSMGGILGMMVNFKRPNLIEKLILNDIAPESPQTTRDQIYNFFYKSYKEYDSYDEISKNLKSSFALFGICSNEDWEFFIQNSIKKTENNKFIFNYDIEVLRSLKEPFQIKENDSIYPSNWILCELLSCPVMLIWGKVSSMLTSHIIAKFQEIKSDILLVKIPETGHAPHMMNKNLTKSIKFWLDSSDVLSGEVTVAKN